jgi:hypothetical protein
VLTSQNDFNGLMQSPSLPIFSLICALLLHYWLSESLFMPKARGLATPGFS